VREVVGRRLDHLSTTCNRILTLAAVIGREFEIDALELVSGIASDQLLEALEEAAAEKRMFASRNIRTYFFLFFAR
jgi:predicted ATPase